jgi:tRNA(adenine34) deaminase
LDLSGAKALIGIMEPISPDARFMQHALRLAQRALRDGEVPVGAIVVMGDRIVGEGWNQPIKTNDPTAHAEIVALRAAAAALATYRLHEAVLYATLEPCAMCIGAIINARIARVVFGAWDQKAGACSSVLDVPRETRLNHRVDVFGGVCSEEASALLKDFFGERRR